MVRMSTYLITGGAGFIGSHLADALLGAGNAVRVLDDLSTGKRENLDPRCTLLVGDAADASAVAEAMHGVAGCFHLAAIASVSRGNEDWPGTHRANQTATVQVLDAARRSGGIPVVYASSAAIYGDQGQGLIREDARPTPQNAYGADKLGSELHAAVAHRVHGTPTCGMRFFNVYGPRQDPSSPYSGVISIFCARLLAGAPVTLHGDGMQTRDFVFVGDVVRALMIAMARIAPGSVVFNVASGRATSVAGLAEEIAALLGVVPEINHAPARLGDIRHSVGDPGKAWRALGFRAKVPLNEGLVKTLCVDPRPDAGGRREHQFRPPGLPRPHLWLGRHRTAARSVQRGERKS
jgi:UDP-glucose 4-epimerase